MNLIFFPQSTDFIPRCKFYYTHVEAFNITESGIDHKEQQGRICRSFPWHHSAIINRCLS
jgi:hypothetical protein